MSVPHIELYVDIGSPFGYIGYMLTRVLSHLTSKVEEDLLTMSWHFSAFASIPVHYTPLLLGGLFQQTGNISPIHIKNKAAWMDLERVRLAKSLKVPILTKLPSPFPMDSLQCQRVLFYMFTLGQHQLVKALDAMYHAFWVEGRRLDDEKVLKEVLESCLGTELAERALEESKSKTVREGLKNTTARAYERGAFGLPWFVATNSRGKTKQFWGIDRAANVIDFAVGDRQASEELLKAML